MSSDPYDASVYQAPALPGAFVKRRLHSLTGLFLVLFLFEHLLTNSQAALFFGDDGSGFVQAVNFIKSLPYLPVIEITLLAVPIAIHGWYGLQYLWTAAPNTIGIEGTRPVLPLPRNRAYNWMRITSVVLVVGILLHVWYMRFLHYPEKVERGYQVEIIQDPGLKTVAERLDIEIEKGHEGKVVAVCDSFGKASLMEVRNAFQSPTLCIAYTFFVLAACFHAMNGVWTFSISWGITLTERSRVYMRRFSNFIMLVIVFLGLIAIWGTYWINLKT